MPGLDGDLSAITAADGAIFLQLSDIHGDVTVQLPLDSSTATTAFAYDEYGNTEDDSTTARYGWLGGRQRSSETPTRAILRGILLPVSWSQGRHRAAGLRRPAPPRHDRAGSEDRTSCEDRLRRLVAPSTGAWGTTAHPRLHQAGVAPQGSTGSHGFGAQELHCMLVGIIGGDTGALRRQRPQAKAQSGFTPVPAARPSVNSSLRKSGWPR